MSDNYLENQGLEPLDPEPVLKKRPTPIGALSDLLAPYDPPTLDLAHEISTFLYILPTPLTGSFRL